MSTVIDEVKGAVKELLQKVPNIEQVIQEVKKQPAKPLADVAYVYNGYDDVTLKHLGMYEYHFPYGKVTRVGPLPEHREKNAGESVGREVVFQTIPLKGESIARELIEVRGYAKKGMWVFVNGTGKVPDEIKAQCDSDGERHARTEIERFKVGREKAKAGTPGYRMKPDARIYSWMKRYSPDDELFAEQSRRSDTAQTTARALAQLTEIAKALAERTTGEVVPEPPKPAFDYTALEGYPIRRKPLETEEQLMERQLEFIAEYDAKQQA